VRYYLTCAIDYVNSRPHLGTAYEKMTADVLARHHRGRGRDVLFLMGNDEHSAKVAQAARERGLAPLAWCDEMEGVFREAWQALLVEPDDFIRTTEPRHKVAVREMVARIHARGDLYQGTYSGWYCVGCEAFKKEDELAGGRCPEHPHRQPDWLEERNWFFRLSRYRDRIRELLATSPGFLRPEARRNELLALLDRGLEDISVTRAGADWGVPFPLEPEQVVYVWFDALINYLSATGWPGDPGRAARWWPADLHLVGKDITRFHAVIWPAMLISAGLEPPRSIFGHGFVNLGGGRMSKDAGHVTDPVALAAEYGPDAIRYFVCAETAFGQDLDWSRDRLEARFHSELSNGLGNLASRVTSMIEKYRDGVVGPRPDSSPLLREARAAVDAHLAAMDSLDLRGALQAAMGIVERANAHVDRTQPFGLARDPARAGGLQVVLAELANSLVVAARLLHPFMPGKMASLLQALEGRDPDPLSVVADAATAGLAADRVLRKGPALFPRRDRRDPEPAAS
jgi:methionyl-tRNA synthetase